MSDQPVVVMCTVREFASRIAAALLDGSLTRDSVTSGDDLLKQYADDRRDHSPHPTDVRVELGYDVEYGASYENSFRVSREKLVLLKEYNPVIYLGEIAGKHSEVHVHFNDLCYDVDEATYAVEEFSDVIPGEIEDALERIETKRRRKDVE